MTEPALARTLDAPMAYRVKRLLPVTPLIGWVLVAVFTLVTWRSSTPPIWLLIPLLCVGVGLVLAALPLVAWSLLQLAAWFRAWRTLRAAIPLIRAHKPDEAEARLRRVLDDRWANPLALVPAMHTLGVVKLLQGEVDTAWALFEKVRDSGWLETFALRKVRGIYAQGRCVALTVLGRVAEAHAELALAKAHARGPEAEAYVAHAEALLALREQRWDAAVTAISATDLSQLPPRGAALYAALEAVARRELGEDVPIALPSDARPAWLAHWPELGDRLGARAPDTP